ncbi:MAG: hypothetical protein DWQ05_10210 [Calditrichaeota bacterium]|nr:MAG: hypothetical protein DWQ05_10210 [Calditrichota bacterium]
MTKECISETKPFFRHEIYHILNSALQHHKSKLSSSEKERLQLYLFEFNSIKKMTNSTPYSGEPDLISLVERIPFLNNRLCKNNRFLFFSSDSNYTVTFNPIFAFSAGTTNLDSLGEVNEFKRTSGGQILGLLGSRISFFLDFRDTKEWGHSYFPNGHRLAWPGAGYAEGRGESVFYDEAIAFINVDMRHFQLQFGKNQNRWGPANSGGLILNNTATSYDQIRVNTSIGKLRFTFFHAELQPFPRITQHMYRSNGVDREFYANKYFVGHRFEIQAHSRLQLALSETVVYGERGVQFGYLNPLMFFRSAEHYYGDRDNVALGFDLKYRATRDFVFYSELLLDDFSFSMLGSDWYGNKQAWTFGIRTTAFAKYVSGLLCMEYIHIRPYVYSHTFPINRYTHYNTNLGSMLQPNSEAFYVRYSGFIRWNWQFYLEGWRITHGSNLAEKNVGGDIDRAFDTHDSQTAPFLDGKLTVQTRLKASLNYTLFMNCTVHANAAWQLDNSPENRTASHITFQFGLSWNYND